MNKVIEDLINKVYDKINVCVDIDYNENTKRLTIKCDEYDNFHIDYEDKSTECHQAWGDFKETNTILKKELGLYSIFEENKVPNADEIEWCLVIKM